MKLSCHHAPFQSFCPLVSFPELGNGQHYTVQLEQEKGDQEKLKIISTVTCKAKTMLTKKRSREAIAVVAKVCQIIPTFIL